MSSPWNYVGIRAGILLERDKDLRRRCYQLEQFDRLTRAYDGIQAEKRGGWRIQQECQEAVQETYLPALSVPWFCEPVE